MESACAYVKPAMDTARNIVEPAVKGAIHTVEPAMQTAKNIVEPMVQPAMDTACALKEYGTHKVEEFLNMNRETAGEKEKMCTVRFRWLGVDLVIFQANNSCMFKFCFQKRL